MEPECPEGIWKRSGVVASMISTWKPPPGRSTNRILKAASSLAGGWGALEAGWAGHWWGLWTTRMGMDGVGELEEGSWQQ